MFDRIDDRSPRAKSVLDRAAKVAGNVGSPVLRQEDILAGLILESRAAGIPTVWGSTFASNVVADYCGFMEPVGENPAAAVSDERVQEFLTGLFSSSPRRQVSKDRPITPDDLAVAVFRAPNSDLLRLLAALELTAGECLARLASVVLTAAHRCDAGDCGAQARALITLSGGESLVFCRHHAEALRGSLESAGAVIETQYEALGVK